VNPGPLVGSKGKIGNPSPARGRGEKRRRALPGNTVYKTERPPKKKKNTMRVGGLLGGTLLASKRERRTTQRKNQERIAKNISDGDEVSDRKKKKSGGKKKPREGIRKIARARTKKGPMKKNHKAGTETRKKTYGIRK